MFDRPLQNALHPLLQACALWLHQWRIRAQTLTLFGALFALIAFFLILQQYFYSALCFIMLNRVLDGLDGAVARVEGATPFGAFLDISCDFLFYGLIPLGFALQGFFTQNSPQMMASALLLCAFYVNGGMFLAMASLTKATTPRKGFYYLAGLMEGAETIAFFASFCLFPSYYIYLAIIFAVLCLLSACLRIYLARKLL